MKTIDGSHFEIKRFRNNNSEINKVPTATRRLRTLKICTRGYFHIKFNDGKLRSRLTVLRYIQITAVRSKMDRKLNLASFGQLYKPIIPLL